MRPELGSNRKLLNGISSYQCYDLRDKVGSILLMLVAAKRKLKLDTAYLFSQQSQLHKH